MKLKGRVAIVTGAGAGIGQAISLRLAAEGAKVIVADLNQASYASGESTVKKIKDAGGEAVFCLTDVSKAGDAENMVKETIKNFGRLDILVNNAGIWFYKPLTDVSEQEWDKMMGVNLKGAFLCSKYSIPEMKVSGGVIINIASTAALKGAASATTYCASKGGVLMLTKAMAAELKPFKIRVNAVCPHMINTDMWQQCAKDFATSGIKLSAAQANKPEDVANAVLFLASDESSAIGGDALVVGEG